jgi:hypothetical protein
MPNPLISSVAETDAPLTWAPGDTSQADRAYTAVYTTSAG